MIREHRAINHQNTKAQGFFSALVICWLSRPEMVYWRAVQQQTGRFSGFTARMLKQ
jgi:hypothetical protein